MHAQLSPGIDWLASMVAIYLICGQSRCLSARGILSIRHLLLGFFATKNPHQCLLHQTELFILFSIYKLCSSI